MTNFQESAKQILAILPGVDCAGFGGCGYPTCEACAQAIAEGGSVALCPACSQDAVDAIAEDVWASVPVLNAASSMR